MAFSSDIVGKNELLARLRAQGKSSNFVKFTPQNAILLELTQSVPEEFADKAKLDHLMAHGRVLDGRTTPVSQKKVDFEVVTDDSKTMYFIASRPLLKLFNANGLINDEDALKHRSAIVKLENEAKQAKLR